MSINPNPENASLFLLEKASTFIVLVIATAVLVTAGGIILDLTAAPASLPHY